MQIQAKNNVAYDCLDPYYNEISSTQKLLIS